MVSSHPVFPPLTGCDRLVSEPRTARMAVCVPPAMSPGLSASMAEVAVISLSGTSELVEDDDVEDEVIEESLDSDSVSEDAEDEGPAAEDEDPATGDEGLAAGDEGPGMGVKSRGLDDESHGLDDKSRGLDNEVPNSKSEWSWLGRREEGFWICPEPDKNQRECRQSRHPPLTIRTYPETVMVDIDEFPTYPPPAPPVKTPLSPEWSSGSLPISPAPFVFPSPISSPMIPLTVPSPESGQGQERCTEKALWYAISDTQGENRELRLQIAKERRAQLELAEIIDNMRRGQEP
ncbi:hypothetical protein Tco_0278098 [Tanacetum coccineum]